MVVEETSSLVGLVNVHMRSVERMVDTTLLMEVLEIHAVTGEDGRYHVINVSVGDAPRQRRSHHNRYFIIKSLNHHNIEKSIENGIWATQAMNGTVLNEAFETPEKVVLVFCVNMSSHFQGYAHMTSPIGQRRPNIWSEANEGATHGVVLFM